MTNWWIVLGVLIFGIGVLAFALFYALQVNHELQQRIKVLEETNAFEKLWMNKLLRQNTELKATNNRILTNLRDLGKKP
jgi:uncharacterized protein HemX